MQRVAKLFGMVCLTAIISACSSGLQPSQQSAQRFFWPPLPDRPRIEWLKQYRSDLDIEKTGWQLFKESLIGEDRPVALSKPVEVKIDSARKRLFVSDVGRAAVYVFDEVQHEMRTLKGSDPEISYPLNIAFDSAGSIHVLDRRAQAILVFDKDEHFIRSINLAAITTKPLAMTIDVQNNHVLVSDGHEHSIHVLTMEGKKLFSFGGVGDAPGFFNMPISLATNTSGAIIVADAFNARIQIFDKQGIFKNTFGIRGDGPGEFQLIKSVALDSDNNIYVVDSKSHTIKIFNFGGDLLLELGGFYMISGGGKMSQGGFAVPVAIDIDSNDMMAVADQLNSRVQIFRYLSDAYFREYPVPGYVKPR
ncbi:MAG: 6-bladed beta-propeller [Desulfuromonadales bacterium]